MGRGILKNYESLFNMVTLIIVPSLHTDFVQSTTTDYNYPKAHSYTNNTITTTLDLAVCSSI